MGAEADHRGVTLARFRRTMAGWTRARLARVKANGPIVRDFVGAGVKRTAVVLLLATLLSGCLATRSEVTGAFGGPAQPNLNAAPVSVLFVFRHEMQLHGFDTIPKLQLSGVKDFDNLFRDALRELSNISSYDTYTELPGDVNFPKRREELAAARTSHDYVIEIEFLEESSFAQQAFMGTVSLLSLTVIPVPLDWDYTISTNVSRTGGARVAQYQRRATLSNWVEAFLIFAYPFYPFEGKREEIFSESLHDTFRQIEAEKVLR